MSKKSSTVEIKNFDRQIKTPFVIYVNFESLSEANISKIRDSNESYNDKYQNHVACGCGYKLVCVDDKFSKHAKTYLDYDSVYRW